MVSESRRDGVLREGHPPTDPRSQAGRRGNLGGPDTGDIAREVHRAGVTVTGYVDDIRPHVAPAACFVVPLRVGGGTRLKILDAWALGKAVISTSVGCEGLATEAGVNIVIADDPEAFCKALLMSRRTPSFGCDWKRRAAEPLFSTMIGRFWVGQCSGRTKGCSTPGPLPQCDPNLKIWTDDLMVVETVPAAVSCPVAGTVHQTSTSIPDLIVERDVVHEELRHFGEAGVGPAQDVAVLQEALSESPERSRSPRRSSTGPTLR